MKNRSGSWIAGSGAGNGIYRFTETGKCGYKYDENGTGTGISTGTCT